MSQRLLKPMNRNSTLCRQLTAHSRQTLAIFVLGVMQDGVLHRQAPLCSLKAHRSLLPLISICYVACAHSACLSAFSFALCGMALVLAPTCPHSSPIAPSPLLISHHRKQANRATARQSHHAYDLHFVIFKFYPLHFYLSLFHFRLRCFPKKTQRGDRGEERDNRKILCAVNFSIGSYYIKTGNFY